MEKYNETIDSIDSALSRLNSTIGSHQLSLSSISQSMSPNGLAGGVDQNAGQQPRFSDDDSPSTEEKFDHVNEHSLNNVKSAMRMVQFEMPTQRIEYYDYGDADAHDEGRALQEMLHAVQLVRSDRELPRSLNRTMKGRLERRRFTCAWIAEEDPYNLVLYILQAIQYEDLDYPDLAAGAAYKALLLADAFDDEADEYHERVRSSLDNIFKHKSQDQRREVLQSALDDQFDVEGEGEIAAWLHYHYRPIIYRILIRCLIECGCFRSANLYSKRAVDIWPNDESLASLRTQMYEKLQARLGGTRDSLRETSAEWPDHGLVRRENYPWNDAGVRHYGDGDLLEVNRRMQKVSSVLDVRPIELPDLSGEANGSNVQFGVFARQDLVPGQAILNERSLLTANNRLQDALCDACSADLPGLKDPAASEVRSCSDCEVVFCSQWCHDEAMEWYHPALCGYDVEAIARDVPPAEAADSLYTLLLLRAIAISQRSEKPVLEIPQVDMIWGDFVDGYAGAREDVENDRIDTSKVPRTLPFSFEHNIRMPFEMLEKIDVDIFQHHMSLDVWHFNVLYAKFRGTASARLSGADGRAIRGPEVSAVHPMWCLANHSCAPNVRWEWGGDITFTVREKPVLFGTDSDGLLAPSKAGIKKDQEILNHYCDINLPVEERREWARGALGGDCQCQRCRWETETCSVVKA